MWKSNCTLLILLSLNLLTLPRAKGEAVLWFAETYGLIPDSLNLHDVETGEAITIDFKGKGNTVLHELKISFA